MSFSIILEKEVIISAEKNRYLRQVRAFVVVSQWHSCAMQ